MRRPPAREHGKLLIWPDRLRQVTIIWFRSWLEPGNRRPAYSGRDRHNQPRRRRPAKVALLNVTTALSGQCPTGATILDEVGYGTTANCFEGSGPAPAPSGNTQSALRSGGGCTDANNNAADFTAATANPRNTASATNQCPGTFAPPMSAHFDYSGRDFSVVFYKIIASLPGLWLLWLGPAAIATQPSNQSRQVRRSSTWFCVWKAVEKPGIGKSRRNDPRNNTKCLEILSVFFVLDSCRFGDRFGFSAACLEAEGWVQRLANDSAQRT